MSVSGQRSYAPSRMRGNDRLPADQAEVVFFESFPFFLDDLTPTRARRHRHPAAQDPELLRSSDAARAQAACIRRAGHRGPHRSTA